MKKIVTIVGARPQFVKLAPVSRALRGKFQEVIVNTGQHYDHNMASVFFEELNIPRPDYDLEVGSASHGKQTGMMLDKIEQLLLSEKPDAVLVYGDTNSTLAGALAASKLHIPLFHIEAGLRSFNKRMPEEINRILTDHVSTLLFAPTETAVSNLQKESIVHHVYNVGDVMYDAVLYNVNIAEEKCKLFDFNVESKQFYLATIHRAENTDDKEILRSIVESLISIKNDVIFPLHPRTKAKLEEFHLFDLFKFSNVKVIDPVSYLEMLTLEKHAKGIITDSGGVQKEAYFMQVPCYTLRNETEWIETVECGWNQLVNPQSDNLADIIENQEKREYVPNLFGDGKSSHTIVEKIEQFFNEQ
ncbi:non-hydrolyzing UDP-N-acetylglucosamine 2-epimerase [Aneurinibacillus sp. UBA3580]|jgi:UDP-N-acetylglucosamine 2-epimerase|uniref:non-hydrolyzing UDP-N-acetylglucosamine 2-epimerase n=1 Tax=Aneurinibacillus sp. UBA3580 TaxID=1946041 RepID=UPI0025794321|nr:UDP-N-acetylglucosamine 2-epimerase (non-hydrolyzing) [Aneurinibacillus sp. UBA3580]